MGSFGQWSCGGGWWLWFSPLKGIQFAIRPQVRDNSDGGHGPAASGLPRADAQPVCRELPQDGAEAAGVHGPAAADTGHSECEHVIK